MSSPCLLFTASLNVFIKADSFTERSICRVQAAALGFIGPRARAHLGVNWFFFAFVIHFSPTPHSVAGSQWAARLENELDLSDQVLKLATGSAVICLSPAWRCGWRFNYSGNPAFMPSHTYSSRKLSCFACFMLINAEITRKPHKNHTERTSEAGWTLLVLDYRYWKKSAVCLYLSINLYISYIYISGQIVLCVVHSGLS